MLSDTQSCDNFLSSERSAEQDHLQRDSHFADRFLHSWGARCCCIWRLEVLRQTVLFWSTETTSYHRVSGRWDLELHECQAWHRTATPISKAKSVWSFQNWKHKALQWYGSLPFLRVIDDSAALAELSIEKQGWGPNESQDSDRSLPRRLHTTTAQGKRSFLFWAPIASFQTTESNLSLSFSGNCVVVQVPSDRRQIVKRTRNKNRAFLPSDPKASPPPFSRLLACDIVACHAVVRYNCRHGHSAVTRTKPQRQLPASSTEMRDALTESGIRHPEV